MSPRSFLWLVALLLAVALAGFAWTGYPPPSTDAPGFLVSAINVALGKGLVNPLYPLATLADPSGQSRHIYHAPLFPLVLATLMPWPTPQGAFLAIALLRAASLLLSVCFFSKLLSAGGAAWRWPEAGFAAASLCGLATHWVPTVGRAEALGTLWVLLAALAPFYLAGATLLLALGTLAGTLAATHPIGGVELVVAAGLYLAARLDTRRWVGAWLAIVFAALVVFTGLLAVSPYGLRESIDGMIRASPFTPWLVPPELGGWRAWISDRRTTLYGPFVLLSLACGTRLLMRDVRRRGSPAGFALCMALFLACFYVGSLTFRSLRNYNLLVMAPILFGLVLAWRCGSATRPPTPARSAAQVVAFGLVLATGAGFFGRLVALPVFLKDYRTLAQARDAWHRLEQQTDARVAIVGNLWVLSEDYARMQLAPFGSEGRLARQRLLLVLAQREEHAGRAPEIPGYRKVADFFNPRRALRRGLLGLFLEDDYAFAVYQPQ